MGVILGSFFVVIIPPGILALSLSMVANFQIKKGLFLYPTRSCL